MRLFHTRRAKVTGWGPAEADGVIMLSQRLGQTPEYCIIIILQKSSQLCKRVYWETLTGSHGALNRRKVMTEG